MSDLAPFVAATLRDKVVAELLEENKTLREEKLALEFVEITGPNREPVYARGHLRDDGHVSTHGGDDKWDVKMTQVTQCPLQDMNDIEVWIKNCFVSLDGCVRGFHVNVEKPLKMLVVTPDPDRASCGLRFIVSALSWNHQELETYARSLPSLQRILDGDLLSADEQHRLATRDILQIDPTAVCTFSGIQLCRDLAGLD